MSLAPFKYFRLIHLFWVFPAYLVFLSFHQTAVFYGMKSTLNNGERITANVLDAQIKRIASQSNGWVIVEFKDENSEKQTSKLGLPVNIASKLMMDPELEIQYKADSFVPIVIKKTADLHLNVVLINLAIALISSVSLITIMFFASRFAERKFRTEGKDHPEIIRVD